MKPGPLKENFRQSAEEIAQDTLFRELFADARIPHGKDGYDHEPLAYNESEIRAMADFAAELGVEIVAGKPVRVYFDNDGTLFRFVANPKDVKMDKDCFAALVQLSQFPNVKATSLTGRDVKEASELMLTPGYEVKDSRGNVLAAANDKRLRFAVTGSHGVENLDPSGEVTRYDFGPEANAFIRQFQAEVAALRNKYNIHIEDAKHGSVGVNVAIIADEKSRRAAYQEAEAILQRYEAAPDNPLHPVTGKKIFQIRREGSEELEMRPVGFGKDFGIRTFGKPDSKALTLFLCDSLGEGGTDTDAARLINDRQAFERGNVIMVRNGRNQPVAPDSPYHVRAMFANPTMLGKFLNYVADQVERMVPPTPKIDAATKPKDLNPG